jgi:8-oxo-dGTP diphosphatase
MKEKLFHIGIKAVIVNNEQALILRDSTRYKGIDLPGGKMDVGESVDQTLKRELNEELGLTQFKRGEILHAYERADYDKGGIRLMLIFYRVEAEVNNIILSDEHTSFEWVKRKDLEKIEFRNDGVKTAIEKAL